MAYLPSKIYIDKNFISEFESNPAIASIPQTDRVFLDEYINQQILAGSILSGGAGSVLSVNTRTGAVVLSSTDVGLGNVNNTSDVNKPVSTATATALSLKQDILVSGTNIKTVNGQSLVGSGDVAISGGGGSVTSVFTRTGAVVAASGDYTATQITNTPAGNVAATTVQSAINELDTEKVNNSLYSTKGVLLTGSSVAGVPASTSVGSNGQILAANSASVSGVEWVTLSAGAPVTIFSNGAYIRYFVISGTPVVSFSRASGVGTISVTGGVIELSRFQINLVVPADCAADGSFTVIAPTTQSGAFLQYPTTHVLNTASGQPPATAAHLVRSPGSTPVITFTAGTAGTSITMKTGDLNIVGSSATIVQLY